MGKQQSQSDSDEQNNEIRKQLKTAMTRTRLHELLEERLDDKAGLSQETKEVALRELNYLIDSTAQQDDDPLTDDVFRARNELRENLTEVTDNE